MCIAFPMTVVALDECVAHVTRFNATTPKEIQTVDAIGIDALMPGDHVLVFRGAVLRKVTPQEAQRIDAALTSLASIMAGLEPPPEMIREAFTNLPGRTPM